jgi:uncharacterized protein involved in exopolysaccharide biosynthesis
MTAGSPPIELGAEREIDLRRWRSAIFARRWFVVAGLVIGIVIGALYSLSGASDYTATVTIQPAQPYNAAGNPVLNYTSSPLAIQVLVSSNDALRYVSLKAHVPESELKGHISTASISTGAGPVTQRGTVLIQITVSSSSGTKAQNAANAFGRYVVDETESSYVKTSLSVFALKDAHDQARLNGVDTLINSYEAVLSSKKATAGLDPFDKLLLVSELDSAVQRQGNLQNDLISDQQAQTLAEDIEIAQIINPAAAGKVTSRSRRNSILFGGLIGLIIGAIVALILGLRAPSLRRPATA